MNDQMDLFNKPRPADIDGCVESMTHELRQRGGWIPAKAFFHLFGWSERKCRQIAEYSEGHILGGNGGYILNINATDAEFAECNGRIRTQGEKMVARAQREKEVREHAA
jgi:hypothetical protein